VAPGNWPAVLSWEVLRAILSLATPFLTVLFGLLVTHFYSSQHALVGLTGVVPVVLLVVARVARGPLLAAFLPVAISCGLTSAITDVTRPAIREALLAADLLFGRDEYAARWLAYYREKQKARDAASDHVPPSRPEHARA